MAEIYFAIPGDINALTGGYTYDRRLIAELHALGYQVHHLALSDRFPTDNADVLSTAGAQFAALPERSTVIVDGLAYGAMDTIAEQHADRLNIIALCHHPLMLEAGLSSAEARQLFLSEQRALQAAKAILVTSAATRKILVDEFSIPATKITVALPGTDAQTFATCIGNPLVLLCVATLTRRKAHDVLIEALAKIKHLDWSVRLVGGVDFDPAWTTLLKNKVLSYELEQRILFVGNVVDPTKEYTGADLFVLPSLFEGYGMAFAEALSFGLPIVAARAGAVPDLVPDSAGTLVPPGDATALAAALQHLLTDSATRTRLQLGAQIAAHHLPRWSDTAVVVAALIKQLPTN